MMVLPAFPSLPKRSLLSRDPEAVEAVHISSFFPRAVTTDDCWGRAFALPDSLLYPMGGAVTEPLGL